MRQSLPFVLLTERNQAPSPRSNGSRRRRGTPSACRTRSQAKPKKDSSPRPDPHLPPSDAARGPREAAPPGLSESVRTAATYRLVFVIQPLSAPFCTVHILAVGLRFGILALLLLRSRYKARTGFIFWRFILMTRFGFDPPSPSLWS